MSEREPRGQVWEQPPWAATVLSSPQPPPPTEWQREYVWRMTHAVPQRYSPGGYIRSMEHRAAPKCLHPRGIECPLCITGPMGQGGAPHDRP